MRGIPAQMDEIMAIATKHKLKVVEDVAQANGGSYRGRKLGTIGDVGCFSLQFHKIITSGEGGIVATNDDLIYTRSQAYHDVAACWRKERFAPPEFEGEIFFGVNFRMSELTGAVALAQLRKLDSLLTRMRTNKNRILSGLSDVKGLDFRRIPDEEGDAAVCLIMFVREDSKVESFVEALQAEGIEVAGIYNKGIPDWHVYHHWRILLDKRMPTEKGCPFNCPLSGPSPTYSENDYPITREWLRRSVHLDIPPQMSVQECDEIAEGIRKVASVLL
jgi:8-amino-3,8-dideoxy-alpha-D-manno-octulosonate transaminase